MAKHGGVEQIHARQVVCAGVTDAVVSVGPRSGECGGTPFGGASYQ
jgi:hypothetical protein